MSIVRYDHEYTPGCKAINNILASAINAQDLYLDSIEALGHVERRALPNSPNGYTPSKVDCPANRPSARRAGQLSQNETSWLELRRNNTIDPMRDLLNRVNITGFDVDSWMNQHSNNASALPNIGIAVSGI